MDTSQRLASFRKMVEADPQNELGQFSLGSALMGENGWDEARACFEKTIQVNEGFSKAYQLLGECWMKLGNSTAAIAIWKRGWEIAHARGDLMPREAMAKRLRELGVGPEQTLAASPGQAPAVREKRSPAAPIGPDQVACLRCSRAAAKLASPPLPGALGERIVRGTCQDCWKEWLAMGVKVINELQLDLTSFAGSSAYDKHMAEFLHIEL